MPELPRPSSSHYGLVVTVQTAAPGHVIHNGDAVHRLLVERLPKAVERVIRAAAPEVHVTVVGVVVEEEAPHA